MHEKMINDIINHIAMNTIFVAASRSFHKPVLVQKDEATRITINSSVQLVKDLMACDTIKDFNKMGFSKSLAFLPGDKTDRIMKTSIETFFKTCKTLPVHMMKYINFDQYGDHSMVLGAINDYHAANGKTRVHDLASDKIYELFGEVKPEFNNPINFYDMENELAIVIMSLVDDSYKDITINEFNEKYKNESQETKDKVKDHRSVISEDKIERMTTFWSK